MSDIRLYIDEDAMDSVFVKAITSRGIDVVTASDENMVEYDDHEHLDYATSLGRAVYTFNIGDFYNLHAQYVERGKEHAGIILVPQQRYGVGEQMRRLVRLMAVKSAEDMRNTVEFLSNW